MFVEIEDDRSVTRGRGADRLEVWTAAARPSYTDHCWSPSAATRPSRFDVDPATARVTRVEARPGEALSAERAGGGTTTRLRLKLPAGTGAITLVYADGDGGGVVQRRIATSTLESGDVSSLGEVGRFAEIRCDPLQSAI